MRHLITGGSGFIGNLAAQRLIGRGESVRVLDLWQDPGRTRGIDFIEASILDRAAVAAAMAGIDIVHHGAALVAQSNAGRRYWDVNVEGTRVVAEEAARAGVRMIVHLSSTSVFGIAPPGPITAATVPKPIEAYGRSKLAGEEVMKEVCAANGIPLIIIRPRVTLGRGRLGIFQILFQWVAEGRNIYLIGRGEQLMQFVHAEDLMDFYMLALDARAPGSYNVGTDRFGSLRADLTTLIRHARSTSKLVALPRILAINALRVLSATGLSPLAPWHYLTYDRECHFDVAPLIGMGWRPRYSNAEMLSESYDWFLANRSALSRKGSPHRSCPRQGLLSLVKRFS